PGIVGGAIDREQRAAHDAVDGRRTDLPIGEVAAEQQRWSTGGEQCGNGLAVDDLYTARAFGTDAPKMRIFGDRASEIVPHGAQDALVVGLAVARQGTAEITPRAARGAQARADVAAEKSTDGRGQADRQTGENRHDRQQTGGLAGMSKVARGCAQGANPWAWTGQQRRVLPVSGDKRWVGQATPKDKVAKDAMLPDHRRQRNRQVGRSPLTGAHRGTGQRAASRRASPHSARNPSRRPRAARPRR